MHPVPLQGGGLSTDLDKLSPEDLYGAANSSSVEDRVVRLVLGLGRAESIQPSQPARAGPIS